MSLRGSGPVAERLRAFVRNRVRKEGAHYERGAQQRLATYLEKPPSWVSNYVDVPATANADLDTALAICAFYRVKLSDFQRDAEPAAMPTSPPLSRHETRALRLLRLMNEAGQKLAVQGIAAFAGAFPRP